MGEYAIYGMPMITGFEIVKASLGLYMVCGNPVLSMSLRQKTTIYITRRGEAGIPPHLGCGEILSQVRVLSPR